MNTDSEIPPLDKVIAWLKIGHQYLGPDKVDLAAATWLERLSAPWRPIESAPSRRTVILSRVGEKLCVTAYRFGPVSGWRHAHSSDALCFEPTHWMDLPEPPEAT